MATLVNVDVVVVLFPWLVRLVFACHDTRSHVGLCLFLFLGVIKKKVKKNNQEKEEGEKGGCYGSQFVAYQTISDTGGSMEIQAHSLPVQPQRPYGRRFTAANPVHPPHSGRVRMPIGG